MRCPHFIMNIMKLKLGQRFIKLSYDHLFDTNIRLHFFTEDRDSLFINILLLLLSRELLSLKANLM